MKRKHRLRLAHHRAADPVPPQVVTPTGQRKIQLTGLERTIRLDRAQAGEDGRVPIALSSEVEVNRGWYVEVLSHDPGAVMMERAAQGLSFLVNHNTNDLAGFIEDITLEDRKLRGMVRFGSSVRAQEISTDIREGIRPFISVGYNILDYREEKRNGVLYIIATRWEPMEGSTVPVPADFKESGVGRSADSGCGNPDCTDPDCEDPECEGECSADQKCSACQSHRSTPPGSARTFTQPHPAAPAGTTRKEGHMTPEELAAAQQAAEELKRSGANNVTELRSNIITDTAAILALAGRAGLQKEASDMLLAGKTSGEVRAMILDKVIERGGNPFSAAPAAAADLSPKEEKEYSVARAIMAQASNTNCLEREVSDTLAKALGRAAGGIYIPTNIKMRAQDATVAATAKNLISQDPVTFIELLRHAAVVLQAGATYLPGCVGNIPFARQITGGTATWTGDNPGAAVAASDPTTETFTMSPKQLMAHRQYSKQLLVQTNGFADRYVTDDLAKAHALEVDRASMFGSGAGAEPKGIVNFSGIGSEAGGANGAPPTWANLVNLETKVSAADALAGTLAYITNAKGRGYLKQNLRSAVAGAKYIWDDNDTINGYHAYSTNQVPSNLVKGTSGAVCSAILYGNWAELLIAEWGALDITTDPYSLADKGLIRVISTQLVDINLRHVQSFSAMLDALMG